jgi:hypothetical protein
MTITLMLVCIEGMSYQGLLLPYTKLSLAPQLCQG